MNFVREVECHYVNILTVKSLTLDDMHSLERIWRSPELIAIIDLREKRRKPNESKTAKIHLKPVNLAISVTVSSRKKYNY